MDEKLRTVKRVMELASEWGDYIINHPYNKYKDYTGTEGRDLYIDERL